jgi:hypothetical protein
MREDHRRRPSSASIWLVGHVALWPLASLAPASPFATTVLDYSPGPGQNAANALFSDPAAALGPPVGGGSLAADNSKLVTIGGFGGSITLGFASTVPNLPPSSANPHGLDAIVFGNAFFVSGNPNRRWAEAGVIEISRDSNNNGLPDDPWFVIPGSHLGSLPADRRVSVTYSATDPLLPPANKAWIPPARAGQTWTVTTYALPLSVFTGPVVSNPLGLDAAEMGIFGYADSSPTLLLGDLDADNLVDDFSIAPEDFYTRPSDPFASAITPGSGGGDAFDIAWAVNPDTGAPANLEGFDFIRVTSAVDAVRGIFGEASVELSGVAAVRVPDARDYNLDGFVNLDDLGDYITDFYTWPPIPAGQQPEAPTYAGLRFVRTPCPAAPDAPEPYAADAYRLLGYRVGFALPGNDPCPAGEGGPNLDHLGDFITAFYQP